MPQLFWDASALIKAYLPETGSDAVDALFAETPASLVSTFLCYAETAAILRRRHNRRDFDAMTFDAARHRLRQEVLDDPDFTLLSVDDAAVLAGIALTDQHNLNSADAAILETYLRYTRAQPPGSPTPILVASDQRLLRAAALEGLATLNPEQLDPANVPALLAGL